MEHATVVATARKCMAGRAATSGRLLQICRHGVSMSPEATRTVWADASFEKYATRGAYHWAEIGRNLLLHNAFTVERYRLVADRVGGGEGQRLLDYGCGDGAFLSVLTDRHRGLADVQGYDPNPLAIQYARAALQ